MRITDADDDYTVTADQRAALMELESLTWNYPTPQQAGGGRAPSALPQAPHLLHDEDSDDDDDDEDSYYVDMVPYDMTERLKEVNRALIEDPTPAECDREITVRFRDVIADYQSPREYYPSDSDDGYGDSSDLLYDAEEEDVLASLTAEVKEVLGGNVNVMDLMADLAQENSSEDHNSVGVSVGDAGQVDLSKGIKNVSITEERQVKWDASQEIKADVPRLRLESLPDKSQLKPAVNNLIREEEEEARSTSQVPCEKTLLKVDDSGLADLETFMNETDTNKMIEYLPDASSVVEGDKGVTMSLIEVNERVHVERGLSSLSDVVNADLRLDECSVGEETQSNHLFEIRDSSDVTEQTDPQLSAIIAADIAYFENSDEFEDSQDEADSKDEESSTLTDSSQAPAALHETETDQLPQGTPQTQAEEHTRASRRSVSPDITPPHTSRLTSRKDQSSRQSPGPSSPPGSPGPIFEKSKRKTGRKSPSAPATPAAPTRTRPKAAAATQPLIKPALLSSEKLSRLKTSETARHRTRASAGSREGSRSLPFNSSSSSSSSSSSPLSSASSSSSTTSSLSTHSSPNVRGRNRTAVNGPVRPTTHRSAGPPEGSSGRGFSSGPVRLPTSAHHGLTLTPISPALTTPVNPAFTPVNPAPRGRVGPPLPGRIPPHAKVRKAASASDLHKVGEEPEDRKRQNEEVFKAWVKQKNKQAAVSKKSPAFTSPASGRSSSELTERRKRAEEAFQAWLSKKRQELRLEKRMRGERRRLEDQTRYARSKTECEVAYKEWCRRKREEVRTTARAGAGVPRSQSLERPWAQEKTRKLYSAYLSGH
nr:serine/arginine repetitive matrix protein 1-like isoform X2 [Procambarus clarkii]